MRANIADALAVDAKTVRILTGQVGGSFGMKAMVFPEYICLLHASRALGRPVKWTDERSGSFVSDGHGRAADLTAELALDADGTFLAVRLTSFANMGAFLAPFGPFMGTANAVKNLQGMYRTPHMEVSTKCVFTNTTQITAYRGAGRPEGNYYMERLIDTAAAEMGIDRLALRRRNQIRPQDFPYRAASAATYDCGDFAALTKHALELADGKSGASARALAIRGVVHLTSQEDDVKIPKDKKLAAYTQILKGNLNADQKRLVLSGIATVDDPDAIDLASNLLSDPDVQTEAEQAVIATCKYMAGPHPAKVRTALNKVIAESKSEDNRKAAQNALDLMKK